MKALVTGAAGFIGSHLVDKLLSNQYSVVGLDNLSVGRISNLSSAIKNPNFTFLNSNVEDISKHDLGSQEIDVCFHLAGMADIIPSILDPRIYMDSNVSGTIAIMEYARLNNIKKVIYAASSSCYGIPDTYPTSESANCDPKYPYALSKYLGEQIVLHWAQVYKIPSISLRLFNVYGPRSRTSGTYGAVIGVFLAQKIANIPLTIVGDGTQTRDFTYVSDVVDAFFLASTSKIGYGIFNVGSGNTYSINELAELIGGLKVHIPKRPGEPDSTYANINEIFSKLSWKPKITFKEGMKMVLSKISEWSDAPVWSEKDIEKETSEWFRLLKGHNEN